ncbi:MAG: UvrD-helicase domain-containing protein, partial [Desulfuromonadales bacterium]|nr:UvrD-helicase domain-containing protein [Desulfuromonadales bacterium]
MNCKQKSWPPDADARRQALDPCHSFIVQAPAGSGKTELLIQRILTLLAICERPEEVLAITFTRKAAGEMKARLLDALDAAANLPCPESEHEALTWERAKKVVERDRLCDWGLVSNPSRLQVMTIDSLCARLVKRMPWLSRFGSSPQISSDPFQLYGQAVENFLQRLDNDQGGAGEALETLLNHLDNRLPMVRDLLVDMLSRRDQWLRHLLIDDFAGQREHLEQSLQGYIQDRTTLFRQTLGAELFAELTQLADFAARQLALQGDDRLLQGLSGRDESPCYWSSLAGIVKTAAGGLRKKVDKRQGFPSDKEPERVAMKQRMLAFLDQVRSDAAATFAFDLLDHLPDSHYAENQWQILRALLVILPQAVVELSALFSSMGQVDFVELAGAARRALGDTDQPEDLLLQFDASIQHILADEFQDTSHGQYALLHQLTAGWTPDDGRTLFVVGDPMQSIYRFREAEVGLYLHARAAGLPSIPLIPLILTANFRSQSEIVDWINKICPPLFPLREDAARGAVTYSPAVATQPKLSGRAVEIICFSGRQDDREAEAIVETIRGLQNDPEKIRSVAILVRSRAHLLKIVSALKSAEIRFQAQEIDPLMARPVTQDLLSLTRALLHQGDRVAWLAILRAPWCGLQADDLLYLCADAGKRTLWQQLTAEAGQFDLFGLSQDGADRLHKFLPVMKRTLQKRGELPLRRLVESCWLSLGGPACVTAAELDDARQIFTLLEELDDGGDLVDFEYLETRLEKLYASPDPEATDFLQVMTIHKAKGLEFDAVILPGLGRKIKGEDKTMLRWIDHPDYGLLLAPIPAYDQGDAGTTYRAIGAINQDRSTLETLRMFYVAVTRARSRLFLYGHLLGDADAELSPPAGSLLNTIWPAIDLSTIDLRRGAAQASDDDRKQKLLLSRLPHSWSIPEFQSAVSVQSGPIQHASDQGGPVFSGSPFSLSSGHGRIVGTVVHEWLQTIADQGLDAWPVNRLDTIQDRIGRQLNRLGVADVSVAALVLKVLKCLRNTISSETGRWLLSSYPEQANELALNGVVDGQIVHAVVDRTFVDLSGARWIIDYKTSVLPDKLPLERFLADEAMKYQQQLNIYSLLLGR